MRQNDEMKTKLRIAVEADAESFIEIKNQLSFTEIKGESTTGGFLLGTDITTYKKYIANDYCLVVEKDSKIIGFGIVLRNEELKQSDIWAKRDLANWSIDIETFTNKQVCYFEQLAFQKGHSREVLKLCYNIICWAFESHTYLFTSTVKKPIFNLAAIPYILKSGGTLVGNINEVYPEIGLINSDIYKIDAEIHGLFVFSKFIGVDINDK